MKNDNRAAAAALALLAASTLASTPASAIGGEGTRTRITLGPQLAPTYPGSDGVSLSPYVGFARADGDDSFAFSAADQSFGFSLLGNDSSFNVGPVLSYQRARKAKDVGAPLDKVKATFEPGGFVQFYLAPSFRIRAEARNGIGGHKGLTGLVSADYVVRDGDAWLFAIGPRLTLANGRYERAYFGVTPTEAVASGLAAYRPDGGIQAAGATAGFLYQLSSRIGIETYAKYDRLVGDAADSPIVRSYGSRDQFSGALALSYTFGSVKD